MTISQPPAVVCIDGCPASLATAAEARMWQPGTHVTTATGQGNPAAALIERSVMPHSSWSVAEVTVG
jgi:hypothetical protein